MMAPAAERLPHPPPSGGETLDVGQEPMVYPCPSGFRPTQAVYGDLFFADRAETAPETSKTHNHRSAHRQSELLPWEETFISGAV